ncbi:hypothetical protein [Herbidospora sp. NBRC 101105]|uniref:hypothetical protein n=1 Tax=Herbidospora sp. NBRC 101105 TaxID=3032195 RepID=UPI0025575EEF|nr:hypothetical protein [Herbidospora sp. NBRC 101105]
MQTVLVKVTGTVLVTALIAHPLYAPHWGTGILGEVTAAGPVGGPVFVAVFFGLVALYCRALERTLVLAGADRPGAVWWMFAIPYNFTEDFFIVGRVRAALAGRVTPEFLRWWSILGYGWCAFQILSLLPGLPGYAGGAVAVPLWAAHWIMTSRLQHTLGT